MPLPTNITREHILNAIEKIDKEGIPSDGQSRYYDLLYNGKKYPPKVVLSFANSFANGTDLDRNSFSGGLNTECFKLLGKEGFVIEEKAVPKKIKLYDLHGASATTNYETLLSPDKKWFYWDDKQFKKYEKGDIVFWINRKARIAIYSVIENNSIKPEYRDRKHYIIEEGHELTANSEDKNQFETFIKFKVEDFREIPEGWNYSDPTTFQTQLMAYILFENNISDKEKRISKLKDLASIFNNGESYSIIKDTIEKLGGNSFQEPKVWFVAQGTTYTATAE
jgi:hypothetical protein